MLLPQTLVGEKLDSAKEKAVVTLLYVYMLICVYVVEFLNISKAFILNVCIQVIIHNFFFDELHKYRENNMMRNKRCVRNSCTLTSLYFVWSISYFCFS